MICAFCSPRHIIWHAILRTFLIKNLCAYFNLGVPKKITVPNKSNRPIHKIIVTKKLVSFQGPIQIIERETIRETIKVVYRFSFRLSLSFLIYKSSHSFLVSFLVQFFSFIVSPIQIIMLAQTRNEKPYEKRMKFIVGSEPTRKFRSELFQPLKLIVSTWNFVDKYF